MKKINHFNLLILLIVLLSGQQGCKKINIKPPENHPAKEISSIDELHLNLLSDEDRSIYLNENNKEKEVVYTCKMHSQIREKKSGVCSICGMKLTLENGK